MRRGELKENGEEEGGEADKEQGVEPEEEGFVASEGSYQMETRDELYEDIPDENCSFRFPKVSRLNWQEDVSSRFFFFSHHLVLNSG